MTQKLLRPIYLPLQQPHRWRFLFCDSNPVTKTPNQHQPTYPEAKSGELRGGLVVVFTLLYSYNALLLRPGYNAYLYKYHELSELGQSGSSVTQLESEGKEEYVEGGREEEGGGISDCSRGQSPRSSTQSSTIFRWSRTQFVHKQHVCTCSSFVLSHSDWPSPSNVCDSFSQRRTQGYSLVCDNPIKVVLTMS